MNPEKTTSPEKQTVDFTDDYPKFPHEKRGEYTILVPDMLPWHFELLIHIINAKGYNVVMLRGEGRRVIDEGLKHVHNDTCYPALCVIGQFLDALKSGKYDPQRTAVLITQSGGGCRASNYVPLIRKALRSEFPQVPVLSLNFAGLEKGNGLPLSLKDLINLARGIFYGDLIMTCFNQTEPYERVKGDSTAARKACVEFLNAAFDRGGYHRYKRNIREILRIFAGVNLSTDSRREGKIKVGIVGEIYVKYSPLGNSHLEDFLRAEGCEPVVPALMDFVLYCVVNNINDAKLYGKNRGGALIYRAVYRYLRGKQRTLISLMKKSGYEPVHDFEHLRTCADRVFDQGVKMGEGWLIPAEMAALCESGTGNIVCAQPFGCLPNHIAGKGAVRTVKQMYPEANIVPVDYDPSATRVNQENRIKLMLAQAKERR